MPDPHRLTILTQLRKTARLSLSDMARACGLHGNQSHQTAGAWELGQMIPATRRRAPFLHYLWDTLALRRQPAQFETIWEMLVEEWHWEPLTDHEWRTLTQQPRPSAAASSTKRDDKIVELPLFPPYSPLPAPFQAPALTDHFVGRQTEALNLATHVKTHRLVALVGMGGIGKTTLATFLAHQLRSNFVDGVLWAPMASAEPQDILQLWAQALGYDLSTIGNVESKAAALRSMMAGRSLLLVLDDVRQATVARILLPNSPTCAVLMTTRDHDIARLLNAELYLVEQLPLADSLGLLEQLIGANRVVAEYDAAVAICMLLEQLPLALEIVGKLLARMPWRPLGVMEQHLRDVTQRLDRLQIKDLSVRASFEVSWEMLDEPLQLLFPKLGVWRGRSFDLLALAQTSNLTPLVAEEGLSAFVALSLLNVETPTRYRQHPLLSDFAYERLQQPEATLLRMADHYLVFCRNHQHEHLLLEQEAENVMATLESLYELQQWQRVVELADLLKEHWVTRAHYAYARRGHAWAVSALQSLGQETQAARHWIAWGYVCAEQGDFAEAETHIRAGLAAAQRAADPLRIAAAQYHLGRLAIERSEHEVADEYLTACEELRRQIGDQRGVARAQHLRAVMLYRLGDYAASQQLCEAALAVQEQQQDFVGLLGTLSLLIDNALILREHGQAEAFCQQAVQLASQHNYQSELAEAYFHYAAVCHRLEQFDQAWAYAEQARHLFERMGNRAWLAHVLYELSMIKRIVADNATAIAIGHESLRIMTELQDDYNQVMCLDHVGELYRRVGDNDTAQRLWEAAATLAVQIHHPYLPNIQANLRSLS